MIEGYFLGSKTIVVAGRFRAYGNTRKTESGNTWTRLNRTAVAGSSLLELDELVTWQTGDEIVIAPTGYFDENGER